MAGPSVMVRVLGDISNLANNFRSVGEHASSAAGKAHAAFAGMFATLNQTGVLGPLGDAINSVDTALGQLSEHGKGMSTTFMAVGATTAGLGVALSGLGSKEKQSQQQLAQAVANTGHSYSDYADQVDKAIKHEEKYGDTAVQTRQALQILTQATGDPTKAFHLLGEASDLAAAKHEDLGTAATQLGKVYNGSNKILKEFGVNTATNTKKTTDHTAAVNALGAKLRGQASASADTFTGHMHAVRAEIEDQVSAFGAKYGPALTGAGAALTALGSVMKVAQAGQALLTASTEAQTAAAEGQAVAEDVAAASTWAALAPILLIILAIGALVVAAYLIWRNWKTIWADMRAAVAVVWDWIRNNWPLLLAIITGPIGLAAYEIYQHWQGILNAAKAVWTWLQQTWSAVYHFVADPLHQAVNDVTGWFSGLLNWFGNLPGAVGRIFGSVGSAISGALRGAFNTVAGLWNGTVGSLSFKVPSWIPGLGGKGFSMPKIPTLDQGGIITRTGLILAHAGEAITPAPAGSGRGPAVHIEHAHFASAVDVDLFMRRAAWAVQTAKV